MGLAAVPFGTAQVHGEPFSYRVNVERYEQDGVLRFEIKVKGLSQDGVFSGGERVQIAWQLEDGWSPCLCCNPLKEGKKGMVDRCSIFTVKSLSYLPSKEYEVNFITKRREVRFGLICMSEEGEVKNVVFLVDALNEPESNVIVYSDVPVFFVGKFALAATNNIGNREQLLLLHLKEEFFNRLVEKSRIVVLEENESDEEEDECDEEPAKPMKASDRIKALFEEDKRRREKDPELEKERMWREKATINARNRIRELIRMDLESRKIKEANKIEKNEIILEEPKVEDKKEEKLFNKSSKEDYFKGFDAFKEKLSREFKAHFEKENSGKNEIKIGDKKSKEPEIFKSEDCFEFPESRFEFSEVVNPNPIKIEDKKEDVKIDRIDITFGKKSLAESICNDKSSEKSEKSDDEDSVSKLTLGSDCD